MVGEQMSLQLSRSDLMALGDLSVSIPSMCMWYSYLDFD